MCGSALAGHTAPPQAKKVLVVSTNQDETIDTSAGTTSSDHAGRKPVPKAMRNLMRSREQETVWQVIPSSRHTNSDEKPLLSMKTAYTLRHRRDCHEKDVHDLGQRTVEINHKNNATGCEGCLSPQLAQRKNEKQKQGEIRDKLGPSDREEKPYAVLRRPNHSAERRIFIHQSHTREFGRCDKAETLHAEDPRTRLRIQEGGLARGRCNQKQRTPSCVLHPRETRWIGIPIQYSRLSSTSSLTATRSTLQIWSVRKKKIQVLPDSQRLRPLLRHWDIPTSAAALGVQENGNFNEDEKTDSPRCPLQSGGKQKFIGTTICRCGAEIKEPNRISKKNSSSHARGQLRQHQGLASTRDHSSTFARKPHTATAPITNCTGKSREH